MDGIFKGLGAVVFFILIIAWFLGSMAGLICYFGG